LQTARADAIPVTQQDSIRAVKATAFQTNMPTAFVTNYTSMHL